MGRGRGWSDGCGLHAYEVLLLKGPQPDLDRIPLLALTGVATLKLRAGSVTLPRNAFENIVGETFGVPPGP